MLFAFGVRWVCDPPILGGPVSSPAPSPRGATAPGPPPPTSSPSVSPRKRRHRRQRTRSRPHPRRRIKTLLPLPSPPLTTSPAAPPACPPPPLSTIRPIPGQCVSLYSQTAAAVGPLLYHTKGDTGPAGGLQENRHCCSGRKGAPELEESVSASTTMNKRADQRKEVRTQHRCHTNEGLPNKKFSIKSTIFSKKKFARKSSCDLMPL